LSQKKAKEEKRTIVFVDQSAFSLLPMAVRTYAPVGQTPALPVKLTRDHLSVMGGITPKGRIFMQTQDHSYKEPDVVRALSASLARDPRQNPGDLGWSFHSPLSGHQRFSGKRGSQTHSPGTLAWIGARVESPRRGVESAQARRTEECLLS
jgi:hypothetical protein